MPKYKEIAEDINKRIQEGNFQEKLPTEKELLRIYHCSRNTIRSAINILVKQGSIHKIQGSGLYINKRIINNRIVINLSLKVGLSSVLPEHKITSKVLDFTILPANEKLAKQFDCPEGTPIYRVKRLRFLDEKPLSIEDAFYNKEIVRYLNRDIARQSIYQYLVDDMKLNIRFSDEYISVIPLSREACRQLELPEGSSSLEISEIICLNNGAIFNISKTLYKPERVVLYTAVQRD
ncbi:MAG: GntR family transcriptional regulator [Sporolactobacillus sp.]